MLTLTLQRTRRDERIVLRNGTLTRYRDGRTDEQSIDRGRLQTVALDLFGVELPSGPFLFEQLAPDAEP